MEYKGLYYAVVPSELPDDYLAKDTKSLVCPFCGSQFEPIRYDVSNETRKTELLQCQQMVHASMVTKTPIVLRCKGCGIEIHNLALLGRFYGEQIME